MSEILRAVARIRPLCSNDGHRSARTGLSARLSTRRNSRNARSSSLPRALSGAIGGLHVATKPKNGSPWTPECCFGNGIARIRGRCSIADANTSSV